MALNDCFFFSACLKYTVNVWWCARLTLALEKFQIWAIFTLAEVASLSQSPQVSRLDLSSGRARHWRGTIYLTLEKNASLDNKKPEWSDERLSSKNKRKKERKKREKSASPSGVIFKAGSVHRWVGYVSPLSVRQIYKSRSQPNKHTIYRTDTGIKLLLIFFYSSQGSYKKKNGCSSFELAGNRKGWAERTQAMHQIDIRARPQSWARRERFRSCQWASFLDFNSNVGFFEGNSESAYGALCKSIDCHWTLRKVYPPVAQLSFEKKPQKIQPLANRKIQEPSALKRKILAGTCDRRIQESLTKDEQASLFSA